MTAMERLRELLDERGVEHEEAYGIMLWTGADGCAYTAIEMVPLSMKPSKKLMVRRILTPEQAIAATFGPGTCWLHDCDGSFSSVNRPVWRCDCGAFMTQYTDATTYHKPRFCPNCGRRVVSE